MGLDFEDHVGVIEATDYLHFDFTVGANFGVHLINEFDESTPMHKRQAFLNHRATWPFTLFGLDPLFPFTAHPIGIPTEIIHEFLVALGNMPNQIQQKQQGRPYPLDFSIFVMTFAG